MLAQAWGRRTYIAALATVLGGSALWLTACGGIGLDNGRAGLACVEDSSHCVGQRQAALKVLIADKERKWVKEPATPEAHAAGVRLFAFRSIKSELSCEELSVGRREAEAAPSVMRNKGKGLSPAQVSRASMLAAEVQKELAAEMRRRRCRV